MPSAFSSSSVLPTRGDFGTGVDDAGNDVVVHVAVLARQDFGDRDAFVLGLVGEHRPGDDVADGVDARHVGGEMVVDDDTAALSRDAGLFEPEPVRIGLAADGDEHDVGLESLRLAAGGRFDRDLAPVRGLHLGDLVREAEFDSLFLEHALELPGDLAVHAGQDAVEEFDHRDLRAEPPPDRAELETDHAGADDEQPLRHRGKRQRTGRGDHDFSSIVDARQRRDVGAGGDDDVLGLERLLRRRRRQ